MTPALPPTAKAAAAHLAAARHACLSGPEWPPLGAEPPERTLAVVGAGTMGCGIALAALAAGLRTRLLDVNAEALTRGCDRVARSLQSAVERGQISEAQRQDRQARLLPGTDWAALSDADVVIEAVYEHLPTKQAVLDRLDAVCGPGTLRVSNTSTLDIDALAAASRWPEQVLGMHFLTPAHITPLLEVVRGAATSARSLARAQALAQRLGKLPVQCANAWGFIGNRMFEGYLAEVDALQLGGVPAERIDAALQGWGFALGPCRTLDMAGTDLVSQVLAARAGPFADPPAYRRVTRALAEAGRLGHKSGRGHYLYEGRQARPDPDLARLCATEAARFGVPPLPALDDAQIVQRCLQPLVAEGQRLLAEGVACRASDIDLVWVLGYGFPAARGGPMWWAAQASAS